MSPSNIDELQALRAERDRYKHALEHLAKIDSVGDPMLAGIVRGITRRLLSREPSGSETAGTHPECPDLAICVCRNNARRVLLDELYEAIHGEEPPAMPYSPYEVWQWLLQIVQARAGVVVAAAALRDGMGMGTQGQLDRLEETLETLDRARRGKPVR